MQTRIRLRRTASSLNSLNNSSNPNHKLRYGEALYSFNDHMMVVGTNSTSQTINNIPNRIIAFAKTNTNKNMVFAGPTSSTASFPTFRALVVDDIPSNIPLSKIQNIDSTYVKISAVKSKGSADSPIYFDANGNAVATTNKFSNYKTIASLKSKGSADSPVYFDSNGNAVATTNKFSNYVQLSQVKSKGNSITPVYFDANGNAVALSYTISKSVPSNAVFTDNNTTYTFASGNGSFSVTPSGGTAQTVSIGKPSTAGTADVASQAVKLQNARTIQVNLSSNSAVSFNGTANIQPGVIGALGLQNGGTGRWMNWNDGGVVYKNPNGENLASTAAATAQNQLLMSSTSYLPLWKSPESSITASSGSVPPTAKAVYNAIQSISITSLLDDSYVWDSIQSSSTDFLLASGTGSLTEDNPQNSYVWMFTACEAVAENILKLSGTLTSKKIQYTNDRGTEASGIITTLAANRYCICQGRTPSASDNPCYIDTSYYNSIPDYNARNSWYHRVYFTGPNGGQVTTYWSVVVPANVLACRTGTGSDIKSGTIYYYGGGMRTAWKTEIGASNKYTHGINNGKIYLNRGSLSNILLGKREGIYIGNGNTTNIIDFNINNIPNIPKAIMINARDKYTAEFNSSGSMQIILDLTCLQSQTYKPPNSQMISTTGNNAQIAISWTNNTCKSITLTFGDYAQGSFNTYNKAYYWYAIA